MKEMEVSNEIQDEEFESLESILKSQLISVLSGSPIRSFLQLWRELEELQDNKEIKFMSSFYYNYYWKACWNFVFSFGITLLAILWWWIYIFEDHFKEIQSMKYIIPGFIILIIVIDILIKMHKYLTEIVLFGYLIVLGIDIIYENLWFEEYRYHEVWIIFDWAYIILSIALCFKWKRMITLYWIIKGLNTIALVMKYNSKIVIYYYFGISLSAVAFPLIWMLISKIILGLFEQLQRNKKLIKSIKNILEVFPESVLIQSLDENTRTFILKFINNSAQNNFINYESPLNKPVDDDMLKVNIKNVQINTISEDVWSQGNLNQNVTLSSLLDYHQSLLNEEQSEIVSTIEISNGQSGWPNENTYFNLKTVKVHWEDYNTSFMHVFINMTHTKKYETEKSTNELLQLTFSNVSHEFRTPLNAFTNALAILEENNKEVENLLKNLVYFKPEIKSDVESLEISSQKHFKIGKISSTLMLGLTEDILDIAKMAAGTFSLNEEEFSISSLIEEIDFLFGFQWSKKNLFFKVEVENNVRNNTFCSDSGRIKQILMNLISNAVKFTQLGGITLCIQIKRVFDEERFDRRRVLKFSVKDTGVGISNEDVKDLFKMFGTVKKHQGKLNKRGTGIGLSLSKKLVESMGGKINVISHEGFGSEFKFNIKEKVLPNIRIEEEKCNNEDLFSKINDSQSSSNLPCESLENSNYQKLKSIRINIWDLKLK